MFVQITVQVGKGSVQTLTAGVTEAAQELEEETRRLMLDAAGGAGSSGIWAAAEGLGRLSPAVSRSDDAELRLSPP